MALDYVVLKIRVNGWILKPVAKIIPKNMTRLSDCSAASTSHDVVFGSSLGSKWIMVLCSLSYSVECFYSFYDLMLVIDFSTLLVQECDQSVLT